jgi:hypothetical protein
VLFHPLIRVASLVAHSSRKIFELWTHKDFSAASSFFILKNDSARRGSLKDSKGEEHTNVTASRRKASGVSGKVEARQVLGGLLRGAFFPFLLRSPSPHPTHAPRPPPLK